MFIKNFYVLIKFKLLPSLQHSLKNKAGAFAEDVEVLCGGDILSVKKVFKQYEKLTRRSGLQLNVDKTEILVLMNEEIRNYLVNYNGRQINISTLTEIKICGIWFCNDRDRAYKFNITDKIIKMESNLKSWRNRNLTYEGQSLIIKK